LGPAAHLVARWYGDGTEQGLHDMFSVYAGTVDVDPRQRNLKSNTSHVSSPVFLVSHLQVCLFTGVLSLVYLLYKVGTVRLRDGKPYEGELTRKSLPQAT
jgi:hypothetical protein